MYRLLYITHIPQFEPFQRRVRQILSGVEFCQIHGLQICYENVMCLTVIEHFVG